MTSIKEKILDKIKEAKIQPKKRWEFQLQEFTIWFGAGVIVTLAALTFAAIIFNLQNADWELRPRVGVTNSQFFFMHLPYFWIILLIGLTGIAYYVFRQTKKGYRYTLPIIILVLAALILAIGLASHLSFRAGRFMEEEAMYGMPYYNMMTRPRQMIWFNPEKGFLIGTVYSPYANDEFDLSDINQNIWRVRCDDKCAMHALAEMKLNERIKIIGKQIDDFSFQAFEIRPFFKNNNPLPFNNEPGFNDMMR